jgi:hypothetical protein
MHPFLELGLYYEQVKRFWERFPKENVCILLYEQYQREQKQAIADVFRFLGVDSNFEPDNVAEISGASHTQVLCDKSLLEALWHMATFERTESRCFCTDLRTSLLGDDGPLR